MEVRSESDRPAASREGGAQGGVGLKNPRKLALDSSDSDSESENDDSGCESESESRVGDTSLDEGVPLHSVVSSGVDLIKSVSSGVDQMESVSDTIDQLEQAHVNLSQEKCVTATDIHSPVMDTVDLMGMCSDRLNPDLMGTADHRIRCDSADTADTVDTADTDTLDMQMSATVE